MTAAAGAGLAMQACEPVETPVFSSRAPIRAWIKGLRRIFARGF
ncbi:hypothetical protein DT23_17900 [Thioclava indica]|uniref:Uncharacterized protein n=1 Tax=Thioclava indica TaxID=1353528 RepID=A0A074JI01_9RHOB|nr:hypothetical protein DT23_17900 [Thioclava indica]